MVEENDDPCRTYNKCKQIKFKTAMLRSSLCGYSDSYTHVRRTVTITGAGADELTKKADERNKELTFKKFICWLHKVK